MSENAQEPMTNVDRRRHIWSAIRQRLPDLRDNLKRAAEADSYEWESALFDGIARQLCDAVDDRLRAEEGSPR